MRLFTLFLGSFLLVSVGSLAQAWSLPGIVGLPGANPAVKLPALSIDKDSVTVSGISAGAFMAVQLGVAYSEQIKGVASIAGGIYACAEGKTDTATNICMKNPGALKPETYENLAKAEFKKGLIDDPQNLAQQRVFILNGTEDKVVIPEAGKKLEDFYTDFSANPKTEFSLKMGHAFPSNKARNSCEVSQFPWINNCHFDGAKAVLETMYGALKQASGNIAGELLTFDQKEFAGSDTMMLDTGNLYVPAACKDGKLQCKLHIALHGCLQSPNLVQKAFTEDAGFNEWADANNIVILYPAVTMGAGNPNGCWDWFGYTGDNYAVKGAPQMTAIMKMVQRLEDAN